MRERCTFQHRKTERKILKNYWYILNMFNYASVLKKLSFYVYLSFYYKLEPKRMQNWFKIQHEENSLKNLLNNCTCIISLYFNTDAKMWF